MEQFREILQSEFIQEILALSDFDANVYFVGGSVRDHFLNLEPKDIDMVVQGVPFDQLVATLSIYGDVDVQGESFGVIKYRDFESSLECEIALPRIDSLDKTKKGHTAIIAQSDPSLPIESDLKRRDFRINSIAIDQNLTIIDPFDGQRDLRKKIIAPTDPTTFIEDPLRMIRALQFAARFDFRLNYQCFFQISKHKELIKEITPERILMEFEKVIEKKGNVNHFLDLLRATGLYQEIFSIQMGSDYSLNDTLNVKTIGELLYLTVTVRNSRGKLPTSYLSNWATFFIGSLKISTKTVQELQAFEKIDSFAIQPKPLVNNNKRCIFDCLKKAPWLFDSYFFTLPGVDMTKFESGEYPKSLKELAASGDDLIALGFEEGKKLGSILDEVVNKILADELENDKDKIISFVTKDLYFGL